MSAPVHERSDAAAEARELARRMWDALPAFLVSGIAVCVVAGIVAWFAPGPSPVTLVVAALTVGPLYAALVTQAAAALADDTPRAFSLSAAIRSSIRRALTLLLPPSIVGALALVALLVADRTGSWLPLVPAGAGVSATVLLIVAALVGLPLGAAQPELRGPMLVLAALRTASVRPVPVLGTIAIVVIAGWAATQISGTLLFLLPAPLAVVSVPAIAPRT